MNRAHRFATPAQAAEACGDFILDQLRTAIADRGRASLAVSGGTTPKLMFAHMSRAPFPWNQLDLFFIDERCVPPEEAESNFRLASDNLLTPVQYPLERVHRVLGELSPAEAAKLYEIEIRRSFGLPENELPVFDAIQLGMGPDGHFASLFPGSPLLDDVLHIAAPVIDSPKPPKERVTLLPGVLLRARTVTYLVAGEDKAAAMEQVLHGVPAVKNWPSQLMARSGKEIEWFVAGLAQVQF